MPKFLNFQDKTCPLGTRPRAFTLVELIMVIVIIGIIAAVFASASSTPLESRIGAAAYKIKSDIRYAQSYAVASQKRTAILFSRANDSYSIYYENTYGANDWSAGAKIREPLTQKDFDVQLNAGEYAGVDISYVLFNTVNYALMFDRDGSPYGIRPTSPFTATPLSGQAGIILNTDRKYILVEPATGRVNVQDTYP